MELKLEQVIVRDEELVVFIPYEAITEGELIIAPIQSFKKLEEIPDALIEKIFHVVNKMSSSLFDIMGCHGTNLLIQNGEVAGQKSETTFIRIIPRFENDNLKLEWTPSQATAESLDSVVKSLKEADEEKEKNTEIETEKKKILEKKEPEKMDKDNYLLKSLRRNP